MDVSELNIGVMFLAFVAGLASFLSPCVFALVPAYVGYLSGRSMGAAQDESRANRWLTLSHGLAFVLGFSAVFVILGMSSSALGVVLVQISSKQVTLYEVVKIWLPRLGGLVVIIFGLHMTGVFRIPFLEYDTRRQTMPSQRWGYLSSALMGVFFAAGWSPCVGPILGTILTLAYVGGSIYKGTILLAAYSAGLAIPFLLAATQIGLVAKVIRKYGKVMRYVEIAMGVILVVIGLLLVLDRFAWLANLSAGLFTALDEVAVGKYMLIALVTSAVLGLIPAAVARQKGRNFVDWWLFSVVLFPVALAAAALIKPSGDEQAKTGE